MDGEISEIKNRDGKHTQDRAGVLTEHVAMRYSCDIMYRLL